VAKRTLNPTYPAKDATFDFPIYLSLADQLGVLELVVWDKDMLTKDYLGEVALPLEDWFSDREGNPRPYAFDDVGNVVSPFCLWAGIGEMLRMGVCVLCFVAVLGTLGFDPPGDECDWHGPDQAWIRSPPEHAQPA
jgi:hypothetical protein